MMNTILVIDHDQATKTWLKYFLSKNGYIVRTAASGKIGLQNIADHHPDLIIIDPKLPDIDGGVIIKTINQDSGLKLIPIIVFSDLYDTQEISRYFEMGIADFVCKKPGIEKEILGKCVTSLIRSRSTTGPLPSGKLISFFSAKGGNGTSTLCLNLAHSIAKQVAPKSVLVIDLVLPLGSLAIMVGIQAGNSIAQLSTERAPEDTQKLKEYLLPVDNWNISILPGSCSPDDGQKLNPNHITPILDSLLLAFDYVIIDLGKTLSRISIPVLKNSDVISIILGADLVTTELTQTSIKYLKEVGVDSNQMFPILNRAVGLEGLTKGEIEDRIDLEIKRTIPYARERFTIATNQSKPYSIQFPNETISMELDNLAELLIRFISGSKLQNN
jgi:Flp pilus assembly CpaE family ATPase